MGLIVGAIVMLVSGYDPIVGYSALWNGIFGDASAIGETLSSDESTYSCWVIGGVCFPYRII